MFLSENASYINGQWLNNSDTFVVSNPASGETIAEVANVTAEQVELAISCAKTAFELWSGLTAGARGDKLLKWFLLIEQQQQALAELLSLEQGKPVKEALAEIAYGASYIKWFSEEAKRIYGDVLPSISSNSRSLVIKQPVGVVAAITPWNFPNAMVTRKVAAALAAGCTCVVKPSELTPLSALALAQLAEQAGIPAGVFNVVVGTNAKLIGRIFTEHPDVAKLSFTGSTAVGKILSAQCAANIKRITMELGGNAPFIVFDDANLDAAVNGAIAAKFRNAGQTCISANRIFVQRNIYESFLQKFTQQVKTLTLGKGSDQTTDIGPLINLAAVDKVQQLVTKAIADGAKLVCGDFAKTQKLVGQQFYPATILTDVTNDMDIAQQEIFGPVASLILFDEEDEVINLANNTPYGLAAYFYSESLSRVWRVSEKLHFGMIGINQGLISNAVAPFGGVKQSGFGREGSKYGLDDYLIIKYLCLGQL